MAEISLTLSRDGVLTGSFLAGSAAELDRVIATLQAQRAVLDVAAAPVVHPAMEGHETAEEAAARRMAGCWLSNYVDRLPMPSGWDPDKWRRMLVKPTAEEAAERQWPPFLPQHG
jgi:hypothetical protein